MAPWWREGVLQKKKPYQNSLSHIWGKQRDIFHWRPRAGINDKLCWPSIMFIGCNHVQGYFALCNRRQYYMFPELDPHSYAIFADCSSMVGLHCLALSREPDSRAIDCCECNSIGISRPIYYSVAVQMIWSIYGLCTTWATYFKLVCYNLND